MDAPREVPTPDGKPPATPASRDRRLDEIFGRDLGTERPAEGDDRGPADGDEHARERWYRENRPPHHEP